MLNVMRRSANTVVIKLLLILLALSFMVWGVGNYVNNQNQLPVAEADGWAIGPQEFSQAYEQEYQRMRERFGGSIDKKTAEMLGLKKRTLNALINRHLILQAASDLHLTVSPELLRRRIATTPAFQVNEQFDKNRYEVVLRNNHLSSSEFERQLTADIVSEQIRLTMGSVSELPRVLLEDIYRLENEKRVATLLALKPADLEAAIKTGEEELTAFLAKHQQRFMTPVKVQLRYAVLNADSVRDTVTVKDEEIQEFYNDHIREYQRPETRQVRHILARIDDKTSAEQAMEKIRKAQERLDKGEGFETVARELSDDASAGQGGDLGEFGRGVMVEPFEKAAFALEAGKNSEPVTTEFGVHLIRVEKIQPAEVKPLAAVSTEIKGRITEVKAKDAVYDRSVIFEDQIAASGNLKAISGDLNLRYKETGLLARDEPGRSGVELEAHFLDAAFSTPKGSLSPLVELPNGQFVALEVVERQEPTPRNLESAREEVTRALRQEKAREEAGQIMASVVKALTEGKSLEEAASLHKSIRLSTPQPFAEEGGEKEPGRLTRAAIFKLTLDKPNLSEVLEEEGELVTARLTRIVEAPAEGLKAAEAELVQKLETSLGQEQLTAYLNGLWSRSNIRVHQEVLDRL